MPVREFITWISSLGALAIILGLARRHRVGVCYSFVGYLSVVAATDLLSVLWPDTFWRQSVWLGKELVIAVFRFGIALELTYRTFRAFPGARRTARSVLVLMLWVTLAVVVAGTWDLTLPVDSAAYRPLISRVLPRLINGSLWLFSAIALLVLWYRVPVHPLHKAILAGYVPYLLVFTALLNLIERVGWDVRVSASHLSGVAWVLLLAYWSIAAWRKDEAPVQAAGSPRPVEAAIG